MTWFIRLAALQLACIPLGCGDPAQREVSVPLLLAGSELAQPVEGPSAALVTVERAELAFGPLYLCAGFQAGELCDTARLEWLDSVVIDLTNPEPRRAGTLTGVTGPVRSWMYDLGISSQLTRAQPFVLDAAAALGGASLRIEGVAKDDGRAFPFAASITIEQGEEAEHGVPVIRKRPREAFAHDVSAGDRLRVTFDAARWIASVDFAAELEAAGCDDGEPCAVRQLEPASNTYRALHNAVVLGARPTFTWDNDR